MRQTRITNPTILLLVLLLSLSSTFASLPTAQASQILTYQIASSTDDCAKYSTGFSTTLAEQRIGLSSGVTYQDNGLRFLNISIDSSYSLYYAKLIFTAYATQTGTKASTIYYEDNVAPATFSNATDFNARTRSAASNYWNVPFITANKEYEIDVTWLVLLNVNNASWVSGSNMTFFWTNGIGITYKRFYSYDGSAAKAVKLEIKYKETFYLRFYDNNDYSFTIDSVNSWESLPIANGSELVMLEETSVWFWTAMNSSFYFLNYTFTDQTIYDNPCIWTMTENFGNATVWAYSSPIPIPTEDLHRALRVLPFLLLCPLLVLALKRRKTTPGQEQST